ncbi:MAG TPA: tyrosine-type recombinase/integrase [Gammaproteobacteria bacterium]|nr:tyrosine-type recombinase/integrase [Gammaproteobacteria bacterium]
MQSKPTTDYLKQSPAPLFDTLEYLNNFIENPCQSLPNCTQDYFQAAQFLRAYRGSEATFSSYRREIERLLQWSWWIAGKSLNQIRRHDIESFVEFCQKPPATWIGIKNVPRFLDKNGTRMTNPAWRPFVATVNKVAHSRGETADPKKYTLSQKALQALFAILGSFFSYLLQEEYVELNPVAQIRQKSKFLRKYQTTSVIRRLGETQWFYVLETAEQLAANDPQHERTLFMMNALYGMYLRISELAASKRWEPQMGHFQKDMDGNWWFTTVGKGNKQRIITVSDAMLAALKRYRQSLNLTPLPYPGETTPLLPKIRGQGPINSTRQIRAIVQDCFNAAVSRLGNDGFTEEAEQLKAATVHWLRHTGISDDVKHRPREHVRDDAGHGSSAITDKYIDIELRARHASGKKKKIKPDE